MIVQRNSTRASIEHEHFIFIVANKVCDLPDSSAGNGDLFL
jgi:hypothetical protein